MKLIQEVTENPDERVQTCRNRLDRDGLRGPFQTQNISCCGNNRVAVARQLLPILLTSTHHPSITYPSVKVGSFFRLFILFYVLKVRTVTLGACTCGCRGV